MSWAPAPNAQEFQGCIRCVHLRSGGTCAAYPERIPLAILSGEVDHMVVRPGQVGDTIFEPVDAAVWRSTGQRVPARAELPARALRVLRTVTMHYELWGTEAANLLAEFEDEGEALAFVRGLLEDGWSPDELSLGPPPDRDDPEGPASLVLTGAPLARRAGVATRSERDAMNA
jgi:hypothetical protein